MSTIRRSLSALAALLILTALYFLVIQPIPSQQGKHAEPSAQPTSPTTIADRAAPINRARTASAAPNGPAGQSEPRRLEASSTPCTPSALAIPELGVDAPVVQVGHDAYGNVGVTSDANKTKAGWFPSTLAGAPRGSIILTGHTYHDETAIFKTDFNRTARLGMVVRLSCQGAAPLSYRVTAAKLDIPVEDYAAYVNSHQLYATDGPPKVVIITCTDWNPTRRDYDQRGVLIATPN